MNFNQVMKKNMLLYLIPVVIFLGAMFWLVIDPIIASAQEEQENNSEVNMNTVRVNSLEEYALNSFQVVDKIFDNQSTPILGKLVSVGILGEPEPAPQPAISLPQEKEVLKKNQTKAEVQDQYGNYLGNFVITAYCDCTRCQGKWSGQTASGKKPKVNRTIAVDPKVIALGSKIHIDGLGWRVAEDTGGSIKGNRIDVYMSSHKEALSWGKKTLQVWAEK